jgi:phosphate acetyltransferase
MLFKIEPRVALLSFSTHGSAKHKQIEKIKSALKIVQNKMPKLKIDGELQADAALLPEVAKIKTHSKKIQGNANVLIFPNLESANIGYKLAKIFGDVQAIGPVIQGLKKPVNDLSRGCNVKEIINTTAITVIQAQNLKNEVN